MRYLINLIFINVLVLYLAGCGGSFRSYNIPVSSSLSPKQFSEKTKIYVQETLKPQDSGEFCLEWHGCLWPGKNTFGDRLVNQFSQSGASSYFLGLSRQERFESSQLGDDMYNHRIDVKISDSPYKKKLESNKTIKNNLHPNEYWIDSKIRFVSNSAGEWFMKSLLAGFTLTMASDFPVC